MSTSSHEDIKHDLVAEDLEARQAHEQGLHAASSAAVPPVQVRLSCYTDEARSDYRSAVRGRVMSSSCHCWLSNRSHRSLSLSFSRLRELT